jgi:hypothetical protein
VLAYPNDPASVSRVRRSAESFSAQAGMSGRGPDERDPLEALAEHVLPIDAEV